MIPDVTSGRWEILVVALILGAAHLLAPVAYRIRRDPERWQAFGGGLSAAYVFLLGIFSFNSERVFRFG